MSKERRFLSAELRMSDDEAPKIRGYAALFDSRSEDLGGFVEVIERGAFAGVLDDDVRALWNHDPNHVLGRSKAGTLRMSQDERGLFVEIDPPASAGALLESMRRGDVDQMSFAFSVDTDDWRMEDGMPLRTVQKFKRLYDVSVVTYPAYPETEAAVRSLEQFRQETAPDFTTARARLRLAETSL